jgi:glycosyltransferase involved in cell wall biosynthesis
LKFSIVIPAHNEEGFLDACLRSIAVAAAPYPDQVEIVVVLNRCTDATERIACAAGARVVYEDSKNLSKIRNAGVAASKGTILLTLDADSLLSANLLAEVDRLLSTGKYVGGGARIIFERYSLGLVISMLLAVPFLLWYRISGGCFWCRKEDFDAVGGFDEGHVTFEDVDFARRLKAYGRAQGKCFGTLFRASIMTSCRKFDRFGDWYFVLRPWLLARLFRGTDRALADKLWYEPKR